jgi:hypothetical protein
LLLIREDVMTDAPQQNLQHLLSGGLVPYAVPVPVARALLGNKGRTQVYEAIAAGQLDAVKDGNKLLITTESIMRRQKALPPAQLVEPSMLVASTEKRVKKAAAKADKQVKKSAAKPAAASKSKRS